MARFTTINHVRTYMEIVEQISDMVRHGELTAGEKLPAERSLAVQLGIGRQSLREALSVLEVMGITEVKKGRGTFVREDAVTNLASAELDIDKVGDPFALMEARKALEPQVAALAAKMAEPEDIKEMHAILDEMSAMLKRGEHPSELDKRLHVVIARISRNPVFFKLMNEVIANMGKRLWLTLKERSLQVGGRNERYHAEHIKIVTAIEQRDSRLAEKLMNQHLQGIEQDLRS